MSRYNGRYDSDRRSRSPRDRSPYGDRTSQFGDSDRRRSSAESRTNASNFQANRDAFRDSLTGREPPRGPKALLDAPSGPRGGAYSARGSSSRGRGRGWRDDSRDRGRDRDFDARDRPAFRDERSRERDRDWRDRDRDGRDSFRGRRPSPQGRGRSPPPGRDFRDARDPPLGVDSDRARREPRDGPLSAGSSNSDPPFGPSSFRGGLGRGGRARGRGDWDRGRGRGGFYDDRDRYSQRSRSQDRSWGRERDDRERGDRYVDVDRASRDARDDRDLRDRDAVRPRVDRASHEPSPTTAKDVSPPPLAPSAPAFGSVPTRPAPVADIQSITGKAPPTGPRALTEERPVSAGHSGIGERLPPTGPANQTLPDGRPAIPIGPRAQQQQPHLRGSNQWINPNLANKKIPLSPKINRSQNFVSQQGRPPFNYRPDSAHSDRQGDLERRPRSSDAKAETQTAAADGQVKRLHTSEANYVAVKAERGTQSARASVDRDVDLRFPTQNSKTNDSASKPEVSPAAVNSSRDGDRADAARPSSIDAVQPKPNKNSRVRVPAIRISLPPRRPSIAGGDQSSDSDDEDMDSYFESEMAKAEAELKKVENAAHDVPIDVVARYVAVITQTMAKIAQEKEGIVDMVGPIPEDFSFPRPANSKDSSMATKKSSDPRSDMASAAFELDESSTADRSSALALPSELQPKVEEMDTDGSGLPPAILAPLHPQDFGEAVNGLSNANGSVDLLSEGLTVNGVTLDASRLSVYPADDEQGTSRRTTPSQMDDEDDTEEEEVDFATLETVREFMTTPPLDDLPDYALKPWYQTKRIRKTYEAPNGLGPFMRKRMQEDDDLKQAEQQDFKLNYRRNYDAYLHFTMSDDPAAVKSRDYFASSSTPILPTAGKPIPAPEAKPEGGRRGASRFSTELDLDYVIQQSIREHQERQERDARAQKEKYRSEKEATVPEMYWTDEERIKEAYLDESGLLPVEKLVATWQVLPPVINFTGEEADLFEKAYLENPKQWGNIAKNVPNRDFKACIQYYYAKKTELNLKDKLKRQPRKRKKGRGKQRSSALVSELGNPENEGDENQETGENGERRRPRRAAAPTWGFEANQAVDSDGAPSTGGPGRRAKEPKTDSGAEKPEAKKGRRSRVAKDKDAKTPKPAQMLAPNLGAGSKPNRSRSNSRAQGQEWQGGPAGDLARLPTHYEVPPGVMQPPMAPAQQQPLTSPERVPLPVSSSIAEVMAPPSLRPEPPPPPTTVPTFDLGQSGPDRTRTPQQASSYWSVSESNDFPGLLRAFGTDWSAIATHMQTKTAVMVKNYYVRQKDGGKPEWEQIATEADSKRSRGEKRPAPPAPTAGPRKRYDTPSGPHRTLMAADPAEEAAQAKLEGQQPRPAGQQPFSRFQVPIASAPANPAAAGQSAQLQHPAGQAVTQAMSPTSRPLRAPSGAAFGYPDREPELLAQQPVRISQKPAAPIAGSPPGTAPMQAPPGVEPMPRTAWPSDVGGQLREAREPRDRLPRTEGPLREQHRPTERGGPLRLKQENEAVSHYEPPYGTAQQGQRITSSRAEPISLARQPEQHRTVVPTSQAYPPAVQAQLPPRGPGGDPSAPQQLPPERPISIMQRPKEPYPMAAGPQNLTPAPAPSSRPAERKTSSLMALLNDDPPASAPPKRLGDVGVGPKSTSTPPPPQISGRPPPSTSTPGSLRREADPYPYSRNAAQPSSVMPSLKPYSQSPQPHHSTVSRSSMVSPNDSAPHGSDRDYYSRHAYPPQHQPPPSNSPQAHHHYPPPSQHPQQPAYATPPSGYQAYGASVSQTHSSSPPPPYGSARREPPPPSGREAAWPQQGQPLAGSQQPPPQTGWPSSQAPPPKTSQTHAPSAWAVQHGAPVKAQQGSGSMQPQQPSSWASAPAAPPPQQGLRDERGYHDPRVQHGHHSSLSGSRYPPQQEPPRSRADPGPPPQGYPSRYATPGPGPGREPPPGRSYTPGNSYDPRGPPPQQGYQEQQMREMQMREMQRDPRVEAAQQQQQQQQQGQHGILPRELRPHGGYDRPRDDRYR